MASKKPSPVGLVILLLSLLGSVIALIAYRKKGSTSTAQMILDKIEAAGYSFDFAKYWVAVSKFETANYTSPLYRDAHNLFGMGYPTVGKDYGSTMSKEGLKSKYPTDNDSIDDLIEYLVAFKYPHTVKSPDELVRIMKQNGYFTADENTYLQGIKSYLSFGFTSTW